LKGSLAALALALLLVNPALAQNTVSTTLTFSGTVQTEYPFPISPYPSVTTNFTTYTPGFLIAPYATGTFYVGTSGVYSATLAYIANGTALIILTGVFSPSTPLSTSTPTTPLSSFLYGQQQSYFQGPAISNMALTAGTQYSYLALTQTGQSGTDTLTLSGPGCISLGTNTCAASVPTIAPFALAALAILLAGMGALAMVKRAPAR
jgi:hypothetical protein